MSPNAHAMKFFRDLGYRVALTQTLVPQSFIRRDAFGFFDLLAFHPALSDVLGIQATSLGGVSARKFRGIVNQNVRDWILSPNRRVFLFAVETKPGQGNKARVRLWELLNPDRSGEKDPRWKETSVEDPEPGIFWDLKE